jgi:hypothetical protein
LNRLRFGGNPAFDNWHFSPRVHPLEINDMLTYRTYALAAAAAAAATALAAIAMNSWHPTNAVARESSVQSQLPHIGATDINAEAAYLPSHFVEQERAARIEPMPPQF